MSFQVERANTAICHSHEFIRAHEVQWKVETCSTMGRIFNDYFERKTMFLSGAKGVKLVFKTVA